MHIAALGRGPGSRRAFRAPVQPRPKCLQFAKTRAICAAVVVAAADGPATEAAEHPTWGLSEVAFHRAVRERH